MNLNEIIWRSNYQLLAINSNDNDFSNPFWGSAFFLAYKKSMWLITANHVVHNELFDLTVDGFGQEYPYKYKYFLINNKNNQIKLEELTHLLKFSFFYKHNHDIFSYEDLKKAGITNLNLFEKIDVALCELKNVFPETFLTHMLKDSNGNILVKEGLTKLAIPSENFTKPTINDQYYIYGVVKNKYNDEHNICRCNVMHCNLQYIGEEGNLYKFNSPTTIINNEWHAVSGSAVFNQDGKVVGMAVKISLAPNSKFIMVVPSKTILRLIDHVIDSKE